MGARRKEGFQGQQMEHGKRHRQEWHFCLRVFHIFNTTSFIKKTLVPSVSLPRVKFACILKTTFWVYRNNKYKNCMTQMSPHILVRIILLFPLLFFSGSKYYLGLVHLKHIFLLWTFSWAREVSSFTSFTSLNLCYYSQQNEEMIVGLSWLAQRMLNSG